MTQQKKDPPEVLTGGGRAERDGEERHLHSTPAVREIQAFYRSLAERGFSVIPMAAKNKPRVKWAPYQKEPASPDKVSGWIGWVKGKQQAIVTGAVSGLVGVDCDSPEALALADAHLPPTPIKVLTRQGEHRYYRYPQGKDVRNTVDIQGVKLDLRGEGGYVIGPYSVHETGVIYTPIGPWDTFTADDLPEFPVDDFAELQAPKTAADPNAPKNLQPVADILKKRVQKFIDGFGVAGEGERNTTLFKLVKELHLGFELSAQEVERLASNWAATRCSPPMESEEVAKTVASALESAPLPGKPPGHRLNATQNRRPRLCATSPLLPDGHVCPPGYRVDGAGIERKSKDGWALVADRAVVITAKHKSLADQSEQLELAHYDDGRWSDPELVPREVVASRNKLVNTAATGFPVHSNNANAMVSYLAAYEETNREHIPVTYQAAQMGWVGGQDGFLLGGQHIGGNGRIVAYRGIDRGDEQIAEAFEQRGTLAGWLDMVRLIEPYPVAQLVLLASLAAPLLRPIKAPNFCTDLTYRTSSGKTITLLMAASAYGDPGQLVLGWDATEVYLERQAANRCDLPLLVDDTATAKDLSTPANFAYTYAAGRTKGRGTLTGTASGARWHGVAITTGEDPIRYMSTQGGKNARLITLWRAPYPGATSEFVTGLAQDSTLHYGHAAPLWIAYLARQDPAALQRRYQQIETVLVRMADSGPASRQASYFAAIELTEQLIAEAIPGWPLPVSGVASGLFAELTADLAEADGAAAALRNVYEWAVSNQDRFYGRREQYLQDGQHRHFAPTQGWAGVWHAQEWEWLGLLPQVLDDLLERLGYRAQAVRKAWLDAGWLATNKGRNTYRATLHRETPRMVAISRGALHELGAISDED